MKIIMEQTEHSGPNAWGQWSSHYEHDEEIESSDVGTERFHYRGLNHSTYKIRHADVGRIITVYTDKGPWTCWVFKS